ncbi:unnamed protein product, partial [Laminaria digitata]
TVLHAAVVHGRADADLVDLLLPAGADINARATGGLTPLRVAAAFLSSGDAAVVLLRRGATKDAIASGEYGLSPLHVAARRGHLPATRALLAAGADTTLRVTDASKETPLDFAAHFGQVEVIRELARHGVDLDTADDRGLTALHHAAWHNKAGVVDALLEAGASFTAETLDYGVTPLQGAAGTAARVSEAVDLLLRWGADELIVDRDGKTAAEVVGADQVPAGNTTLEAVDISGVHIEDGVMTDDADRVRELLANAPADRVWRRRGLLLLCLARDRIRRRRTRSGGKGKWKMKDKRVLVKDAGGGSDGGGGSAKVGDFGGVVAMLLEFEGEGLFRAIVEYL